jgi:3-methyladenine DNA glycosylase AlkD
LSPEHRELLAQLRQASRPTSAERHQSDSYGGSGHLFYFVSAPDRRAIARAWIASHRSTTPQAVLAVVESLVDGQSHEEKTLGALLIGCHAPARAAVRPGDLDRWLGKLNGWAEIDCQCHNLFTAAQMLADWPAWRGLIEQLSKDQNINKRRASLVLLNGPVRYSDDERFADLALAVIERLKVERAILITKAISWLLRSIVQRHLRAVEDYLAAQGPSLPRSAVRETNAKLATGVKSGRRRPTRS